MINKDETITNILKIFNYNSPNNITLCLKKLQHPNIKQVNN